MKKRNLSVELFRTALMFGICFLHAVSQGDYYCTWLVRLLCPCVCGFVFISGWYGVGFSARKVVGLYGIGLYAAMVASGLWQAWTGVFDLREYAALVLDLWKNFWFLHGYVVMMCFAPAVDFALDRLDLKGALQVLGPVMGFSFVWSWGASFPVVGSAFPVTAGLGAYSGFTLLAVYAFAGICRRHFPDVPARTVWLCFAVSLACVLAFGGMYHSPFAALLAASSFYAVKRVDASDAAWLRAVSFVTPSLFSIYLLHSHTNAGFPIMKALENALADRMPVACAYFATAVIVFASCLLLDLPRRASAFLFARCGRG